MAVVDHESRLIFFNIPKVGSSSVKALMIRMRDEAALGEDFFYEIPHRIYHDAEMTPDEALRRHGDYWKFAVVRDPVQRLLSAYEHRVADLQDQHRGKLARTRALLLGLPMNPTREEFFARFARHRLQNGSVRTHTHPYRYHLGDDLSRLDAVYRLEDLQPLADEFSRRAGKTLALPHSNRTRPARNRAPIGRALAEDLLALTDEDYRLVGHLYPRPTVDDLTAAAPARAPQITEMQTEP